jgi:hypothetical protein
MRAGRVALLLVLGALSCATWRTLPPERWEQANAHTDVFRTRLRVTRLDGRRFYLEQPQWTPATLSGSYPAGWPAVAAADSLIVVPRDSIARLDRLESDRARTIGYLAVVVAGATIAILTR